MEHKSSRRWRRLRRAGLCRLRFNFRAWATARGVRQRNGEVEDLLAMVQHARDEFGHLPLILSGFSFGGYGPRERPALHPQAHKLVLVAPAVGRFQMRMCAQHAVLHGEHTR